MSVPCSLCNNFYLEVNWRTVSERLALFFWVVQISISLGLMIKFMGLQSARWWLSILLSSHLSNQVSPQRPTTLFDSHSHRLASSELLCWCSVNVCWIWVCWKLIQILFSQQEILSSVLSSRHLSLFIFT